jgi:hypothetical protein
MPKGGPSMQLSAIAKEFKTSLAIKDEMHGTNGG